MFSLTSYRREWLGNVRADLLAGVLVALALIPEAISFAIMAGVDPKVGLYASFSIAVVSAIAGGRPGMISAATAATAVVMTSLVRDHGLQYLLAATVLAGVIQVILGLLKLGDFIRYVSRPVMTGFVNALAMLIVIAQLPHLDPRHVPPLTYALVVAGLVIIYLFPRVTRVIPSALVAIIILTVASVFFGWDVHRVADMGELPDHLPYFLLPDVPFDLTTLRIILPYSVAIAIVGLLESLMTQNVLDDLTDTRTDRNQECIGQGLANFVTGLIGGMAGCAVIGQSILNVQSGGRGRLSCFVAGVFLLICVVSLSDHVGLIPMPALVAVMIMMFVGTFSWSSFRAIRTSPRSASIVMLATFLGVILTRNLAIGGLIGMLLSGFFFITRVTRLFRVTSDLSPDGRTRTYGVHGQLFFGSAEDFIDALDFREVVDKVMIDLSRAEILDVSGVQALDRAILKFRRGGAEVEITGMNEASRSLVDRVAAQHKPAPDELTQQ